MTQEALKLAHWSDCAVHREPAYPNGECDCGGIVTVADYTALSDKYVALSDKYVALKAQHKEQEPVGINGLTEAETNATASVMSLVNTTPLERTWAGLTDDEYFALQMKIKAPMISVQDYIDAMRMVEAKLKEKNT